MAYYDLMTLLEVLRVNKTPTPFFLNQFFKRQINFKTPEIIFDVVYGDDRKMAPFVAPNVQGRVMKLDGYNARNFRPAYVKPKFVIDPNMHIERIPGEVLATGSLTIAQRRDAVIAECTRKIRVMCDNRNEWLAARALIDGQVTIVGEDYPSTTVNFQRDASLSAVLTTTARWTEAGTANPLLDLKTMRKTANSKSGAKITTHVFGGDAWDLFAARVNLKEMMNKNYGGQETRMNLISDGYEGVEFMGTIQGLDGAGRIDAWVHTGKLINPINGAEEFLLDQKTVVGIGDTQGIRCFGAIKDKDADYQALEIFIKNWGNEDPSVEYLLGQSAPLMVPKQPDASFKIKVAD